MNNVLFVVLCVVTFCLYSCRTSSKISLRVSLLCQSCRIIAAFYGTVIEFIFGFTRF
jgi:hypothetical protein